MDRINSEAEGKKWFNHALSKLYPIETMDFSIGGGKSGEDPGALQFCWSFFRPSPTTYKEITAAVNSFSGIASWEVLRGNPGICIAAFSKEGSYYEPRLNHFGTGEPPTDQSNVHSAAREEPPAHDFISQALTEIPLLCQHIEDSLGLRQREPQPFDPSLLLRLFTESQVNDVLEDFYEPGMHTTWLIKDTRIFRSTHRPTSNQDRRLHFGLAYHEWLALLLDALGVNASFYEKLRTLGGHRRIKLASLNEDVPDYPLLSRIRSDVVDIAFEFDEITLLREECLKARSGTSNIDALRGIDKLLRICSWSSNLRLGAYLLAP